MSEFTEAIGRQNERMKDLTYKIRDKGNDIIAGQAAIVEVMGNVQDELSGLRVDIRKLTEVIQNSGNAQHMRIIENLSGFANKYEGLIEGIVTSEEIKPETKENLLKTACTGSVIPPKIRATTVATGANTRVVNP